MLLAFSFPSALAAQQPVAESPATMVDVRSIDSTIRLASPTSIVVRGDVADRLARVARRLATGAIGLKVYAGYRTGEGPHAEGRAVDLTMVDLSRGTEIPMGSRFPEADTAAAPTPVGGREGRYRQLLARVMTEEGFVGDEKRWWHFELSRVARD